MFLNKLLNASYNFLAPSIDKDADKKIEVVFPTSELLTPTVTATTAVTVERSATVIDMGVLAQDTTLNLTIGEDVPVGAQLTVKAKSDATARGLTFGDGASAAVLSGTISKTKVASFVFDGTEFIGIGSTQID